MKSRVIFLTVKSPSEKCQKIIETATSLFNEREPLHILTRNTEAMRFIDELLWKEPLDSFLPHSETEGLITINSVPREVDSVFNLTGSPILSGKMKTIYEFDDESKKELTKELYKSYKQACYQINLDL